VRGKFNDMIFISMPTPSHRTMQGRRVFISFSFD
jgi:hypothetical protein